MTDKDRQQHYGRWALGAAGVAVAVYATMMQVTLAHLEQVAGMAPFDMRPLGYDVDEATRLLGALGAEGRSYYLARQIPLDLIYPAALALTLIGANLWLGSGMVRRWGVQAGTGLALGAALADYAENLGIALMIRAWPQVPEGLVQAANIATVTKAGLTTGAVLVTLMLAATWTLRRVRLRRQGAQNVRNFQG